MAIPREVPDLVPAPLRTSGDHGRIRARRLRLLRLGRKLVSEEEERLQVRVPISERGLRPVVCRWTFLER